MDNSFFRSLYSKKSINEIQDKINLMGLNDKYNAIRVLNLRLVILWKRKRTNCLTIRL